MMKRFFMPLTLLCISFFSVAQEDEGFKPSDQFKVEVGAPYPVIDGIKYYSSNGESITSIKIKRKNLFIQKFDTESSTQITSNTYEDYFDEFSFIKFLKMKNKLYILLSKKDEYEITFYTEEVNIESTTLTGNKTKLISYSRDGFVNPFIRLSGDSSKLMLYYRHKPIFKDDDKNFDKYTCTLFSEELEKQWSQTVQFPYTESLINNVDVALDNDGELYILTEVFKEKSRKKFDENGKPKFKYSIIKINDNGLTEATSDIDFDGKKINQSNFFEDNEGNLILAGIYGTKKEYESDGIYTLNISKEGELINLHTYEIPTELFKQYVSERAQRKIDKKTDKGQDLTWNNLVLRKIFYQKDGSVIFNAETFYVVTTRDSKGNTTTTYYYKDMLTAKINKNGELEWMKKLPKYVIDGDFSLPLSNDNYQYVFFIDNPKNLNLTVDQYPYATTGNRGILTAYKISNEDGSVEKLHITNFKDVGGFQLYQFSTNRIIQFSETKLFVECYKKGKEDIMLKIEIKD